MHFQVMAKPAGASCNLDCSYCFYKEKQNLYPAQPISQMPFEVLESYIRQTIEGQSSPEYHFAWQGGEPTLLGIDYFQKIVSLQERYVGGARINNTIQTNGTLLTDSWCRFFKEHGFLVGLSIDGPRALHDKYRRTRQCQSSFDKVMIGVELLKKYQVPFNTLTVVNDSNSREPLKVYNFLKKISDGHMQFIPAVERSADQKAQQLGLKLARPPSKQHPSPHAELMAWSVKPEQLATFYLTIFHEWVQRDVGRVFVQFFDVALGNWLGAGSGLCQFAPMCGQAGALEYNGDLYSCDHYVYPQHRLGNIMETPLAKLLGSARQEEFGESKKDDLPEECRQCEVMRLCHGDCSKHRFVVREGSNTGVSYLCQAYKKIFSHLVPYLEIMARLLYGGRPVSEIMGMLGNQTPSRAPGSPGRNAACSCGSGQKYKKCCGKYERMR